MEDFLVSLIMSLIVLEVLVTMFSNLWRFFLMAGVSGERGKVMCGLEDLVVLLFVRVFLALRCILMAFLLALRMKCRGYLSLVRM